MKFEEKIKKLEEIVATLESDTNDLEDSINKYSEAMKLVKECDEQLKNIEESVNKIVNENGELEDLEIESGFSGMDIVFGLTSNDIVVLQFSFVALIPLVLGVIGILLNILSSKLLNLIGAVCLIGGAVMLIFVPNFIVYSETLQYMVDAVEKLDITPFVAGVGAYLGAACFGLAGIVSLGKALVTK